MTKRQVITVRVLPNWRICYRGKVYSSDELVELDVLTGAEWSGWGSVRPVRRDGTTAKVKGWAL